ncbi:hypothetical protein D2T29_12300 [Sinirhodobacter populi]|uniref:Uncharacterized protein n=1 Tax=Paenirhodobacter populi TaxID=2306993 RepID=A0A443KCB4_9RHOB|nr:hypothetical protein [Sinirhodobacter populi]RWR30447.1 hypothetical protein D2T29_12300 [Sinirhodobacter populi]
MSLEEMSRDAKSLLLFFETCAVDHGGLVRESAMNADDFSIAEEWRDTGYARLERVRAADLATNGTDRRNYVVFLSDRAFNDAHALRRERANFLGAQRTRLTVAEAHAAEETRNGKESNA